MSQNKIGNGLICHQDSYTIPKDAFLYAILQAAEDLCVEAIPNEKGRRVFLLMLPYIPPEGITANELYSALPDPASHGLGSPNALKHHLTQFEAAGIVVKDEAKYRLAENVLKRMQPLEQLLHGDAFRELLELYFENLSTLVCILARAVQGIFPEIPEAAHFTLAQALITAGTRLAQQELTQQGVLVTRCPGCRYPLEFELETDLGSEEHAE